MEKMIDIFSKKFNEVSTAGGVVGIDQSKERKKYSPTEVSEEKENRVKSTDYLEDGVTLSDIMKIVKNKKLSNNKIKAEIRKLLKDPEELTDFLKSFIKKSENKEESEITVGNYTGSVGGVIGSRNESKTETKEVSSSGGGVGAYEAPLFGDMKEKSNIKKVETKEATSTASSGAYEGPTIWAKTTNKKNWKPSRKTQIPGGKFVQVKKKCKRFPYCNQGDIKALNIFENNLVKDIIEKVSDRYNLHEDHIKDIILYELRKTSKL